mgnify:CR=1 FL=1
MKNWIKTVCFLLWTCVMCTACIDDDVEEGTVDLQTGESIPVFSVVMDDGQIITSETLKGEVSLIVFFHTGCPDCRKELPVLQKIYTDYGRRIRMVCISREESSAEIVRYWDENHLTLPYSAQENRTVYYQFAKLGIPRVYVIDKELVIRSVFTDNPLASYEDLAEAKLDSATGIYNKKAITDMITEEINKAAADNKNRPMYLMILDIDNFKSVNDSYGHYFGDEVIKSFADSLRISVGGRGLVGRIGGDEFMVLLKDVSVEEVRIMLKSMRKGLKMLLAQKQPEYLFSTSIGISQFSKDGTDFETLFKIADAALYIAKEKGKDRYIIYDYDKHGDILADMKHDIAFGNEFMKPMAKYELAANIVMKVSLGQMKVMDVLSEIMDKLNIHGISIFAGNDMKCIYSTGHYKIKVENASYIYKDGY